MELRDLGDLTIHEVKPTSDESELTDRLQERPCIAPPFRSRRLYLTQSVYEVVLRKSISHKSVNLCFTLKTRMKDKLTDLGGIAFCITTS